MPKRIQRKRTRGWKKPEGAVYVGRGSKWGNPYSVKKIKDCCGVGYHVFDAEDLGVADFETKSQAAEYACELYTKAIRRRCNQRFVDEVKAKLKGKDLMCWCRENEPCHADVLLKIANN